MKTFVVLAVLSISSILFPLSAVAEDGGAHPLDIPELARPRVEFLQPTLRDDPSRGMRFRLGITQDPVAAMQLGPKLVELSTFDKVLGSADKGGYLGLGVGYLGNLFGIWDEKTALAIMGAGAALGTAWGVGASIGVSKPSYRYEWDQ